MTVLTAYVYLLPEQVESAIAACRIVRGYSVKEKGCEKYDFFQSPDDPTQVVFVEEWTTREDLELHFQQDAFKEFAATMESKVAKPTDMRIFESVLEG